MHMRSTIWELRDRERERRERGREREGERERERERKGERLYYQDADRSARASFAHKHLDLHT